MVPSCRLKVGCCKVYAHCANYKVYYPDLKIVIDYDDNNIIEAGATVPVASIGLEFSGKEFYSRLSSTKTVEEGGHATSDSRGYQGRTETFSQEEACWVVILRRYGYLKLHTEPDTYLFPSY